MPIMKFGMKLLNIRTILSKYSTDSNSLKKRNSIGRLISLNKEAAISPKSQEAVGTFPQSFPVVAACTAESYDFGKLLPFLQRNFQLSPFICDDVLHVQRKSDEIFFFKNGSLVFWSFNSESTRTVDKLEDALKNLKEFILPSIRTFEVSPFKVPDFEELTFKLVSGGNTR